MKHHIGGHCSTWDSAEAMPLKCIVIVCRSERVFHHHGRVSLVPAPSGIWTPCSSACSHGAQIHGAWWLAGEKDPLALSQHPTKTPIRPVK